MNADEQTTRLLLASPAPSHRHRRYLVAAVLSTVAVSVALVAAIGIALFAMSGPGAAKIDDLLGSGPLNNEANGYIPDDEPISPFAEVPAIDRLDPDLRDAVRSAARAARDVGVDLRITSGWRSEELQAELLKQSIRDQGVDYATAHVLPPSESEHVRGLAVDVGPTDAADWMSRHGAEFGLCQTYANEIWHYELVASVDGQCPPMRANARD